MKELTAKPEVRMDVIPKNASKKTVFRTVENSLKNKELQIKKIDDTRPWGGFFVIGESSLPTFSDLFFTDFQHENISLKNTLSPKILLVEPGKRLSWQYHHRRSEIWTVIAGEVGIILSDTDEQKSVRSFTPGNQVKIDQGKRHRLVGLDDWGIVAEIWIHSDPEQPSSEKDIVRLDDDFGR